MNKRIHSNNSFHNYYSSIFIAIIVFIHIYMSSSYLGVVSKGTTIIGVSLVASLLSVFIIGRVNARETLIPFVLIFIVFITSFITGDSLKDTLIMVSIIIIAMLFVASVSFHRFVNSYMLIMIILAIFSLISYIVALSIPSLIRLFPSTYFRDGFETYNLGLAFINLGSNLVRNMSVFWEPGAYQSFLVLAILFEMLIIKRDSKKVLVLLFACLLSTWSTTGIINFVLLLLIYFLEQNKIRISKSFKLLIFVSLFLLFSFIVYPILPYNFQYAIFGKIYLYFTNNNLFNITTSVRIDSIIYPARAFFSSPLFGVGFEGLKGSVPLAGFEMTTNTPVNWFAAYGIFYGLIMVYSILKLSKSMTKSYLLFSLVFIVIILSISTQNYLRNVFYMILSLYGLSGYNMKLMKNQKIIMSDKIEDNK